MSYDIHSLAPLLRGAVASGDWGVVRSALRMCRAYDRRPHRPRTRGHLPLKGEACRGGLPRPPFVAVISDVGWTILALRARGRAWTPSPTSRPLRGRYTRRGMAAGSYNTHSLAPLLRGAVASGDWGVVRSALRMCRAYDRRPHRPRTRGHLPLKGEAVGDGVLARPSLPLTKRSRPCRAASSIYYQILTSCRG